VAVQEAFATGQLETLYNLRVAEYHTYFVGSPAWGFAAWAHNACRVHGNSLNSKKLTTLYYLVDEAGRLLKWGVTSNPARRYSKKFLRELGAELMPVMKGNRRRMVELERSIVSQFPREPWTLNREPWAASMFPR
jgi:hypothetical protein